MSENITRRDFLTMGMFKRVINEFVTKPTSEDERKQESLKEYFSSPMYSYPLLQEMPWTMLIEEAERLGIPTEGRSKNDIARDIFMKTED